MSDPLPIVTIAALVVQVPILTFLLKHCWDKIQALELKLNQIDAIVKVVQNDVKHESEELDRTVRELDELLNITSRYNQGKPE